MNRKDEEINKLIHEHIEKKCPHERLLCEPDDGGHPWDHCPDCKESWPSHEPGQIKGIPDYLSDKKYIFDLLIKYVDHFTKDGYVRDIIVGDNEHDTELVLFFKASFADMKTSKIHVFKDHSPIYVIVFTALRRNGYYYKEVYSEVLEFQKGDQKR